MIDRCLIRTEGLAWARGSLSGDLVPAPATKGEGNADRDEGAVDEGRHAYEVEQMLMYGKEASNRKQEIDRQHYTIPNQRPKDKHCGKI